MMPVLVCLAATLLQKPGDAGFPTPAPSERHNEKVAAIKAHNYDLLMIGDSITQCVGDLGGEWEPLKKTWDKHFASRNAINLGYSGYRTENILWNLQNGELEMAKSPKVAVLLIGTNNTDDTNYPTVHSAAQVFAGTKAIVDTIRQKHPTTKILVLRIFPRGGAKEVTDFHRRYKNSDQCVRTCEEAGLMTKKLADGKHVFWLDINKVFFHKDGTMDTDMMPDLVHPGEIGAEAWATALEPMLSKLMDDKPIKGERQIASERAPKAVREFAGRRVVVLGDSITQDGRYVSFMEYLLEKQYPWLDFNFFSVGLSSETACGLTEEGHPFPRPDIHERLGRALKAVRPDVVMACYGMNDGIYQSFDKDRFEAFQKGIASMVEQCKKSGAKVFLVTPPAFDKSKYGANLTRKGEAFVYGKPYENYDEEVLGRYAKWEFEARPGGAHVVELHHLMATLVKAAQTPKSEVPAMHADGDGVHPNDKGHFVMAATVLVEMGASAPNAYAIDQVDGILADPLFKLVDQHRRTRSEGWLSSIGYTRGETVKADSIIATEDKAREIQAQIDKLRRRLKSQSPH